MKKATDKEKGFFSGVMLMIILIIIVIIVGGIITAEPEEQPLQNAEAVDYKKKADSLEMELITTKTLWEMDKQNIKILEVITQTKDSIIKSSLDN